MKIKVIHRKLGKEKAWGLAHADGVIEIEERLKGKKHLEIVIHEALHVLNPTFSETKVIEHSKEICRVLWSLGYRQVRE